ncbi:penicillin-binding protein 1A [Halorhodospira halophila]|uniref:Penicillin-binding protein 1A n=1 Tax=Halorhodospira halophila (strain DSM 244 / SL1) TaxID=349124 RepID=A1WZA5_HALHL|nr:penicillin-binding protein 1A [Halorhodospira halophila]ABM63017.1 penicillin-binding protein, 1A family [Halorhodospira halophila SL1]MBK1727862.1 penicillin-binding protein 1A [Halorhodospira halophila]
MKRFLRILLYSTLTLVGSGAVLGAAAVAYALLVLAPQLPDAESLRDVRFQQPLRVVSAEGELIAEYGEQRRQPEDIDDIPTDLLLAFIAAEDDRFYEHPGVDYQGLARAVSHVARERSFGPGGSTITMQVARNFFLSREVTILRKVNEILLALQIERTLSKEEILELYLNKIYLGNRAYGVAAAAQVYYGKDLDELDLAQMAMIAGLPKAPSAANPIRNPRLALQRRAYVLGRMLNEGFISPERYQEAMAAPVTAELHAPRSRVDARYAGEMVRRTMTERYGAEEAYTGGYTVYTTIEKDRQEAANRALRSGLRDYDQRHGYRGPEGSMDAQAVGDPAAMNEVLGEHPPFGGLQAAVVLAVEPEAAWVWPRGGRVLQVDFETMEWARAYRGANRRGPAPEEAGDVLEVGDIVRVMPQGEGRAALSAVPDVSGALVAQDPLDGRVRALAGGFDFRLSSFNRAVQARRQTGSVFKPFIYSAALEGGYTPATLVNDAPVVFRDDALESYWRPGNYSGRFYGPTRLREALVFSRNLVSIRVLRDVGIDPTIAHAVRMGFPPESLPRDLSLALGSNSATPLQMSNAFAAFANGGYRVFPNIIERVEDGAGEVVFEPEFPEACELCRDDLPMASVPGDRTGLFDLPPPAERVLPEDNAWLISDMLADVIERGTGRGVRRVLDRGDLAGKTGTTNDLRDAWFVGYNQDLVATAWIGFDDQRSLGRGETGASAALPIWARFMSVALDGVEERPMPRPGGLVTVRIDPESGRATSSENPDAIFETFREETVPVRDDSDRRQRGDEHTERELF